MMIKLKIADLFNNQHNGLSNQTLSPHCLSLNSWLSNSPAVMSMLLNLAVLIFFICEWQ